jgi:hypothetical protein
MVENGSILVPKSSVKFICDICDYKTSRKSQYERHLTTDKHKNIENGSKMVENDSKKFKKSSKPYKCSCGKSYTHDSGLYRHKKSCENIKNELNSIPVLTPELVLEILKDNKDMKEIVIEQNKMINELIKNGTHNITNNTTNNNCNNKTFNLQLFLNETCKDAMNIMDFVDSIKLQLTDLESVGELGYVKGLSNIIVKNLRALDVTKRPVHCSDAKREILYVKDNDVWEKEDVENPKMKKAVKYIAYKNTKLLPLWKQTYPECMQYDSSKSDKYNYMVIEAMGGAGDNEAEKINKIIKQIAKEVVIDK